MKKILLLIAVSFGISVLFSGQGVEASEKEYYPSKEEIEKLNNELQNLVEEANEKLSQGEEDIEVSSENLYLGFKVEDEKSLNRLSSSASSNKVGIQAIGSKSYQAYVGNTTGFNFRHAVHGTFTWDGSILKAITYVEDLTGPMYSKSASTTVQGVDGTIGRTAKIGKLTSKGTFTPLKWSPASFYTTLVVDFYAPTKSYKIITAKVNM
ncbi:hypothetical protein [Cytobacillus horneckiae]|uniref:hypothetical protein n=1 Tax=Cytobacillus horneckiae TaxID=549687 RepID=UPI003D1D4F70